MHFQRERQVEEEIRVMWNVRWHILLLSAVVLVGRPGAVCAQASNGEPVVRTAGTVANLFEAIDLDQPVDGLRLELPEDWELEQVHLLQYGTAPVAFERQEGEEAGTVLLTTNRPFQAPHELVLRLRIGDAPGTFQWSVTPFIQSPGSSEVDASEGSRQVLTSDRITRQIRVEEASFPADTNRALDLSEASTPLHLSAKALPSLGRMASFTIEFWLRTSGLEEVILSTWNGDESVAYPAEFMVDRSGRLRFYCGKPGQHEALRTQVPIADDRWHHVAVVYDAADSRLRLVVDGAVAASRQAQVLPSSPGPIPIAVGGRLRQQDETDRGDAEEATSLFTGQLDEIRVWEEARSVQTLRRMRTRPFAEQAPKTAEQKPVRLSFNEEVEREDVEWPTNAQRKPATLSFQVPLRDLRAETQDRNVALRWRADPSDGESFVIERSTDGTSFTPVARLTPAEAASSSSEPTAFAYTDEDVQEQVVFYRVRLRREETDVEHTSGTIKIGLGAETAETAEVELIGNFPNPFIGATTIAYEVHETQPVTLTVWNLAGHRVATLADGTHEPGYHEKELDAEDLPSGTYFARLQTPNGLQSHRMVVLK